MGVGGRGDWVSRSPTSLHLLMRTSAHQSATPLGCDSSPLGDVVSFLFWRQGKGDADQRGDLSAAHGQQGAVSGSWARSAGPWPRCHQRPTPHSVPRLLLCPRAQLSKDTQACGTSRFWENGLFSADKALTGTKRAPESQLTPRPSAVIAWGGTPHSLPANSSPFCRGGPGHTGLHSGRRAVAPAPPFLSASPPHTHLPPQERPVTRAAAVESENHLERDEGAHDKALGSRLHVSPAQCRLGVRPWSESLVGFRGPALRYA